MNDYDLSDEYLEIYDDLDLWTKCNGGKQAPEGCNSFSQCLTDYPLGTDTIPQDSTYYISIEKTSAVDALCGKYTMNAFLTIKCYLIYLANLRCELLSCR